MSKVPGLARSCPVLMENIDEYTPDLELARLAREGDESAFEEIVRRYSPRVFSVASRFFRQRSQVEESAQEIFLRAYTHLGDFEGRGSFEGWLTRIATTTCLNLLRHNQRRPESTISDLTDDESEWLENTLAFEMAEKQPTIEDALIAADLAEKILDQVSTDDRLVLTMIDGAGATIKEVAVMTGWSESKVKVQTFRARRRMRDAVGKLITRKR